jgi:hypothetical protein
MNVVIIYDGTENPYISLSEEQVNLILEHQSSCPLCEVLHKGISLVEEGMEPSYLCLRIAKLSRWDKEVEQHLAQIMSHTWIVADFKLGSVWIIPWQDTVRRVVIRGIRTDSWLDDVTGHVLNALFFTLTDYATGATLFPNMTNVTELIALLNALKIGEDAHE